MTTLAKFMMIAGADNRPPMLEKSLYDSWKSRMKHYMENRKNRRMILSSVQNGPLIWPTIIEEDGLPLNVYAIVSHHKVAKEIWDRVKLLMQGTKLSLQEKECKLYDEFDKFTFVKGETLYQYYWRFAQLINNMNVEVTCKKFVEEIRFDDSFETDMDVMVEQMNDRFVIEMDDYKGNATSSGGNNVGGQARVVKCYNCQCEGHMARQCTQPKRPRNAAWFKEKAMLAEAQEAGQILDEEQLAFLADPGIPNGQAAQTTIPNTAAF
ncbi:retrotransposon protein, putative, unclassified [Tanacetum coccineum]